MALRRTFSLRSLFSARFYQPSYSGISLRDNAHEEKPNCGSFLHQRSFSSSILSQHLRSSSHLSLCTPFNVSIYQRSMSTSHVPGSDESGNVNEVAGTDPVGSGMENVASQVPFDWSFHFDGFQPLIETVHSYTGLNWWSSIVLTTLLIRGVTIPLMIANSRWVSRVMMLLQHSTALMDTAALAGHSIEFAKLRKKYGVTFSLSPFLSPLLFHASICMGETVSNLMLQNLSMHVFSFLLHPRPSNPCSQINNMAGEIASFKTGGALWFTDLTTRDALIFPLLTGLTIFIMIECDAMIGAEGMMMPKKLIWIIVIPMFIEGITMSKAEHCYLMSCMLFSIAFTYVIRRPGVMKHFRIPEVPEHVPIILWKRFFGKWL